MPARTRPSPTTPCMGILLSSSGCAFRPSLLQLLDSSRLSIGWRPDRPRRVRRYRPVGQTQALWGTIRGEPAIGRKASRRDLVCGRIRKGPGTMKQSFASAARLRGGGPILPTASKPWSCSGHRHLGSLLTASRESAIGRQSYAFALLDHQPRSGRRPQHNADRDFAGHDQAPQRDQQFPSECHDHRRLAHALRAFGPRPIPLRQCAVLLEP